MPDIKIKRYADKENLKKLVKYSKATFAIQSDINENFYTKDQVDILLESVSGGTGGGGTGDIGDNYYTKSEIDTKLTSKANSSDVYNKSETDTLLSDLAKKSDLAAVATSGSYNDLLDKPTLSNYYTKKQIDILLSKVIVNQQVLGGTICNTDIDEYNNETEQTMKTVSAVVEPTSVNAYTIAENSDTVEEL